MNFRRTTSAVILCFALLTGISRSDGAPALWLVQSPTAKAYLFGTIHIMKPGVSWTTPAIDKALSDSADLWLEVPDDLKNPQAFLPQVQSLGMDPQHPLSTKISKSDLDKLDTAFKNAGLPGEAPFEPFRPWLAGLMVSLLPSMKAGYSGESGIDPTLRSRMTAAGKPIKGFETVEQQLHFFADLPPAAEVAFLHDALASPDSQNGKEPTVDQLAALWRSGNVTEAAKYETQMGAMDPSLAAILVTQRNVKWAKQLDERLKGSGTSFVAVGLLHLVGNGSLIDDLTKMGYTVTRVE